MLPLTLGIVGTLVKDQPLDPASWRAVHEKLQENHAKYHQMENCELFYAIDTSLRALPMTPHKQLQLMAVMASGVVATLEMLANLWKQVTHGACFSLLSEEWNCVLPRGSHFRVHVVECLRF